MTRPGVLWVPLRFSLPLLNDAHHEPKKEKLQKTKKITSTTKRNAHTTKKRDSKT